MNFLKRHIDKMRGKENTMSIDEVIDTITLTEKERIELSQLAPVYDAAIGYLEELKDFKELGVTPSQIRKISECYKELATEHGKLKQELAKVQATLKEALKEES